MGFATIKAACDTLFLSPDRRPATTDNPLATRAVEDYGGLVYKRHRLFFVRLTQSNYQQDGVILLLADAHHHARGARDKQSPRYTSVRATSWIYSTPFPFVFPPIIFTTAEHTQNICLNLLREMSMNAIRSLRIGGCMQIRPKHCLSSARLRQNKNSLDDSVWNMLHTNAN